MLSRSKVVQALAVAGAALAAAASCWGEPAAARPAPLQVGFSPGFSFMGQTDARFGTDLDGMASVGATWIRIDVAWSRVEDDEGDLGWGRIDRAVEWARDRDLDVLGILAYTPRWARPDERSDKAPPEDVTDFADFARAAAQRYGPDEIAAWELWNEPNVAAFWEPEPDPAAYMELASAAASAIRSVRPGAVIVSGGLAPAIDARDGTEISPRRYLRAMYDFGAAEVFDAIALHPYSWPARPTDPDTTGWNLFLALPELRDLMERRDHGGASMWLTEFGAPTGDAGRAVSEHEQAAMVVEAMDQANAWPWVSHLFIYSYRDAGDDSADVEQNFGVVDHDGDPKPARDALAGWIDAAG